MAAASSPRSLALRMSRYAKGRANGTARATAMAVAPMPRNPARRGRRDAVAGLSGEAAPPDQLRGALQVGQLGQVVRGVVRLRERRRAVDQGDALNHGIL